MPKKSVLGSRNISVSNAGQKAPKSAVMYSIDDFLRSKGFDDVQNQHPCSQRSRCDVYEKPKDEDDPSSSLCSQINLNPKVMKSVKRVVKRTLDAEFDRIDERIDLLLKAVCHLEHKVNMLCMDMCSKIASYGKECLQNFHDMHEGFEVNKNGGQFDYLAEVDDSAFDVVRNSDGSTYYTVCLAETGFERCSTTSVGGDFIIKIRPTHTESLPTYIRIPKTQVILDSKGGPCPKKQDN